MYMFRTLEGSTWEEMMLPPFRKIEFDDQAPVVTVSTYLRAAWTAAPGEHATPDGVGTFMRDLSFKSKEEQEQVAKNSDLSTVHTPWRDAIYDQWNHVFYDTMNFLQEAAMGVGHFHPPSHDVFSLSYQTEESDAAVEKVWDKNVMLIPAYLAPGATVTMSIMKDGESKELGKFDGSNTTEIWFLRKSNGVCFKVDGEAHASNEGPAAVMVFGIGCNGEEEGGEKEGGEKEGGEKGEVDATDERAVTLVAKNSACK